jgi:lysophospholipase L1-like esterase
MAPTAAATLPSGIARRLALAVLCLALLGARQAKPVTIWLAGDSTMAEKLPSKRPETGWGEMLGQFFRPEAVQIANRAVNGRSTRSFIAEGRWAHIVDSVAPGDFVFIQFGHNDESHEKADRYTTPEEFKGNLRRMIGDVRARGARAVLFTPVERRRFDPAGRLEQTHGAYPGYTRQVAGELGVPLIDMHASSRDLLEELGADSSMKLFLHLEKGAHPNYPEGVADNTHFRPLGAELLAREAVSGIKQVLPELAALLKSRR